MDYSPVHRACEGKFSSGVDDRENQALMNTTIHRRACHNTFNPLLDAYYEKGKTAVTNIDTIYHKGRDHGASHYFHMTKRETRFVA